jgi:hypothetical protein
MGIEGRWREDEILAWPRRKTYPATRELWVGVAVHCGERRTGRKTYPAVRELINRAPD